MSELWWRNPSNYIRELRSCNESNVIFDYGWLVKRHIKDPISWAEIHYGSTSTWRMMVCGSQGTAEFRPGSNNPVAVYPTWEYGDDEGVLESYFANNVGDDKLLCIDPDIDILERPVAGQEHRIVVMNFPRLNMGPGKLFLRFIKELQESYPEAILHIHGAASTAVLSRMGFKSYDWEPRSKAAYAGIILPTGKDLNTETQVLEPYREWIRLCGFKPVELHDPRNRCLFNIRAARWSAEHFTKDLKISFRPRMTDSTTSDAEYDPVESTTLRFGKVHPRPGDKFVCNSCSMAIGCKFYREGSVCTVPRSEPKELASFFRTRDVDSIIDGLAAVIQINADRLERGLELEQFGGLDPEVTKIAKSISDQGEKLAKLIDPSLRAPKVEVKVGRGSQVAVGIGDPRQVVAAAIRELEQQGYTRDEITPKMIEGILNGTGRRRKNTELEGKVIDAQPVRSDDGEEELVFMSELPF